MFIIKEQPVTSDTNIIRNAVFRCHTARATRNHQEIPVDDYKKASSARRDAS